MGEGKSLCVFGKCFTKFSKVKYFTTFYKEFYGQRKIFYKFDYILPANKHLKIEKYFTSTQTKCAFRYHLFCWKLKIENNKKIIFDYYSQIKKCLYTLMHCSWDADTMKPSVQLSLIEVRLIIEIGE